MTLTFVDTKVLISTSKCNNDTLDRAIAILDDPDRVFVSSDFVKLELMPKPIYCKNSKEINYYDTFFSSVSNWAPANSDLIAFAFAEGERYGLSALDALHVAAALKLGVMEFVTIENPDKSNHRFNAIPIETMQYCPKFIKKRDDLSTHTSVAHFGPKSTEAIQNLHKITECVILTWL